MSKKVYYYDTFLGTHVNEYIIASKRLCHSLVVIFNQVQCFQMKRNKVL